MKERPLLMRPEMAKASLEEIKTQTRRVTKPTAHIIAQCPYGKPGDRLWVRERFFVDHYKYYPRGPFPNVKPPEIDNNIIYRADGTCCEQLGECGCEGKGAVWRPSIHMPRWASRLTLEIVAVRVERLQDITAADAQAEGWPRAQELFPNVNAGSKALTWYQRLWESINGKGSWDKNPFVWVVTFKKL